MQENRIHLVDLLAAVASSVSCTVNAQVGTALEGDQQGCLGSSPPLVNRPSAGQNAAGRNHRRPRGVAGGVAKGGRAAGLQTQLAGPTAHLPIFVPVLCSPRHKLEYKRVWVLCTLNSPLELHCTSITPPNQHTAKSSVFLLSPNLNTIFASVLTQPSTMTMSTNGEAADAQPVEQKGSQAGPDDQPLHPNSGNLRSREQIMALVAQSQAEVDALSPEELRGKNPGK